MDIVAFRDSVLDPLEHDNGDAVGKDRPTGICVERPVWPSFERMPPSVKW